MSPQRQIRPSNAERTPYEAALGQAYAEGRLDLETYQDRMLQVAQATSMAELERCVEDVPFTLRAERVAATRRALSRRRLLGVVGLAAVAGATGWATTLIPEPAAEPAVPATPTPSVRPPATPGAVATTMAQVPFGTADSFAVLVGHLGDLGVTGVSRVLMWTNSVNVDAMRGGEPVDIMFRTDWAPEITPARADDSPTLPPSDLAGLDAAALLARTGDLITLGTEPMIDVRWYRRQWVASVRGTDETVYWDITGTTVLTW